MVSRGGSFLPEQILPTSGNIAHPQAYPPELWSKGPDIRLLAEIIALDLFAVVSYFTHYATIMGHIGR